MKVGTSYTSTLKTNIQKEYNIMNINRKAIKRFGMYEKVEVKCYDDNNLFIHGGITIIAALAGEGKTTYIIEQSKIWKNNGYEILHFNFDNAPVYDANMLNPPVSEKDFNDFYEILEKDGQSNDIIIIDSLKAMVSYMDKDIESNRDMYKIMSNFRTIAKKTGTSFVLIHHVYKNKAVKSAKAHLSGSRAIEEQCDSAFIYEEDSIEIVKNRAGHQRNKIIDISKISKLT